MNAQIVVVIGAGGIGQAIGRRQGTGRTVLLADRNDTVARRREGRTGSRRPHRGHTSGRRGLAGVGACAR